MEPASLEPHIKITPPSAAIPVDNVARFEVEGLEPGGTWIYDWSVRDHNYYERGVLVSADPSASDITEANAVDWRAQDVPTGVYTVYLKVVGTAPRRRTTREAASAAAKPHNHDLSAQIVVQTRPLSKGDELPVRVTREDEPVEVSLRRTDVVDTPDLPLWSVIRASTNKIAFNNYAAWMDRLFCHKDRWWKEIASLFVRNALPFPDIVSYKALKLATEAFLMTHCGVALAVGNLSVPEELRAPIEPSLSRERFDHLSQEERDERMGLSGGDTASRLWKQYLVPLDPGDGVTEVGGVPIETLPYLALIRQKLPEARIEFNPNAETDIELCYDILGRKFTSPCFIELIWSYWHEEGMVVDTIGAIAERFQNRGHGPRDPLATLQLDALRPLNNLLWGYVQDEQHRLTRARRVYEYDHEYGLTLYGRGVPRIRSVDPRSRFLEAFHTLLHRASIFYKEDDDTTTLADPFPVLNALRDVHLLLAEGADNAYGDLPWTARQEMMIEEWLLARPELRDFLPTRPMVAYPEPWMDRVDAMKKVQGWSDTSVRYFRDLGLFGEQLLLSIRYGDWSNIVDRNQAGNWARYWRQEVQWYMHAYQTVTGVDLSADTADVRSAQRRPERFAQPGFLIHQRVLEQRHRARIGPGDGSHRRGRRLPRFEAESEYEEQPLRRS